MITERGMEDTSRKDKQSTPCGEREGNEYRRGGRTETGREDSRSEVGEIKS